MAARRKLLATLSEIAHQQNDREAKRQTHLAPVRDAELRDYILSSEPELLAREASRSAAKKVRKEAAYADYLANHEDILQKSSENNAKKRMAEDAAYARHLLENPAALAEIVAQEIEKEAAVKSAKEKPQRQRRPRAVASLAGAADRQVEAARKKLEEAQKKLDAAEAEREAFATSRVESDRERLAEAVAKQEKEISTVRRRRYRSESPVSSKARTGDPMAVFQSVLDEASAEEAAAAAVAAPKSKARGALSPNPTVGTPPARTMGSLIAATLAAKPSPSIAQRKGSRNGAARKQQQTITEAFGKT